MYKFCVFTLAQVLFKMSKLAKAKLIWWSF